MRPPHAALVVSSVLLLVLTSVPAGSAAPPPEGVCGVCGSEFERTAEENGIDATVRASNLTVQVTPAGDSHWTAIATLNRAAADQFARNRTLLDRTVRRTYASYRTVVDDPENLSVTLDDRTVTVTFTVANAAHRYPGGVLVFDEFARYPPDGEAYNDADTLIVTGPSGTTVTHSPPGSTARGNRAVWTADADRRTSRSQLGREATVAFAPDGGLLARAATAAAVRTHALGPIQSELREYALLPAVLLGLVAGGLLLAGDRLPPALARGRTVTRWLAVATGLYAALTVLALLVAGDDYWLVLGIVGIGLAPQTLLTAAAAVLTDSADVNGGNVPRIAAVTVLAWTLALVVGAPSSALLVLVSGPLIFLPFGVLAGVRHPTRFLFPLVAALGPVVAALPFVPRVGVVFVSPAMLAAVAIGTALLGVPLFAIGRRTGRAAGSAGRTDHPDR
jgi:hypothetical protein